MQRKNPFETGASLAAKAAKNIPMNPHSVIRKAILTKIESIVESCFHPAMRKYYVNEIDATNVEPHTVSGISVLSLGDSMPYIISKRFFPSIGGVIQGNSPQVFYKGIWYDCVVEIINSDNPSYGLFIGGFDSSLILLNRLNGNRSSANLLVEKVQELTLADGSIRHNLLASSELKLQEGFQWTKDPFGRFLSKEIDSHLLYEKFIQVQYYEHARFFGTLEPFDGSFASTIVVSDVVDITPVPLSQSFLGVFFLFEIEISMSVWFRVFVSLIRLYSHKDYFKGTFLNFVGKYEFKVNVEFKLLADY